MDNVQQQRVEIIKYQNDPMFHALAKFVAQIIFDRKISRTDAKQAVEIGIELADEYELRRFST